MQENLSGVLHYEPIHVQRLGAACTRDQNVSYHEKYMNGGNTGVFKKNSVCRSKHPHENNGATSVYIEKATYQINSISGGQERHG